MAKEENTELLEAVQSGDRSTRGSLPTSKGNKFFEDQKDFEEGLEEVPEELEEEEEEHFADDEVEEEGEESYSSSSADEEDGEGEGEEGQPLQGPISVDPCLAQQLGEKSIQVKYRGEIGIDVIGIFEAATHATAEIFDETKAGFIPDSEPESSMDEELEDDDDESN